MNVFLWSALAAMSLPVGGAIYAVARWWLARRRLERAFKQGRERRHWPNSPNGI